MSDAGAPVSPVWVTKRDGQLVPFEADKISRSLFAAAENLGRADPFLARELTDSVVHFLAADIEGNTPTTQQVAEVAMKVVRELGHPGLAAAYAAHALPDPLAPTTVPAGAPSPGLRKARSPLPDELQIRIPHDRTFAQTLRECACHYAMRNVYTRDLVSLHQDGLITLGGLDHPDALAASLMDLHKTTDLDSGLLNLLEGSERRGGGTIVLDSPEHLLAPPWPAPKPFASGFARRLEAGLHLAGLRAVANLNAIEPPAWAEEVIGGPLFQSTRAHAAGLRDDQADELAREWTGLVPAAVRVDWHLSGRDFALGTPPHDRLLDRVQAALRGANLAFVFDRARRPLALAEGLTRRRCAVLLYVGLHLPRLAELTGMEGEPERFFHKLDSLTRLALSAGVQKREFLRRLSRVQTDPTPTTPDVNSGFLLDRAAVVLVPVGLDEVVRKFTGHSMSHGGPALDFARSLVQKIQTVLRDNARGTYPEACLDSSLDGALADGGATSSQDAAAAIGLTAWDATAASTNQLRAGGTLHATAEGGTLVVLLDDGAKVHASELAEALRFAWEKTEIVRVRFARAATEQPLLFGE